MIVYLAQDIPAFVMYCVNGESHSSLLIEFTDYDYTTSHSPPCSHLRPQFVMDVDSKEEYFIELILSRHARKLLTSCCLRDLGKFSAHLDFNLEKWLSRERCGKDESKREGFGGDGGQWK